MTSSRTYPFLTFTPTRAAPCLIFALGVGMAGCNQPTSVEDPTVTALVSAGDSVDASETQDVVSYPTGLGHVRDLAEDCDPAPVVTTADACGAPVTASVAYQWTGCTVNPPPGAPTSQTPLTSTGTLDIATELPSTLVCPTDASHPFDRVATFSIERVHPDGRTVTLDGTATTTLEAVDSTGASTKHLQVDVTRDVVRGGTDAGHVHVTGEIDVVATGADLDRRRTIDGTLRIDGVRGKGQQPIAASLTLRGVVRAPRAVCFWPSAGSIERQNDDGTSQVVTFGPDCGHATRDGVSVDLSQH